MPNPHASTATLGSSPWTTRRVWRGFIRASYMTHKRVISGFGTLRATSESDRKRHDMTPPPGLGHSAEPPFGMRRPSASGPSDVRRQAAAQRLAERRRRTRTIRKWVIGSGVAVFLAAWALIFANVILGNDPALSKSTAATASTQSSTSSGSSSSGGTGSTSSGSTSSGSGSSGQSSSSSPSSVTTSQS
jgi:uncharacterized membrane protein YgcG